LKFMITIARHFKNSKTLTALFLLTLLIEVAYAVAAPYSLKFLVDEAFEPKNMQMFVWIVCLLLGAGGISVIANLCGDYAIGRISGSSVQAMRSELLVHVQKQSPSFFQRYRIGDLMTRFSSDMSSIEGVIRVTIPSSIKELLSVLLGLSALFLLEWRLTLAVIAGSVLMFAGPKLLQKRAERDNSNYRQTQEQFVNAVDEMLKGHKTIQSLNQQQRVLASGKRHIKQLFSFGLRLHMTNALMERLPMTALLLLNGTMIGFGGYLILQDELTIGGFMAFFTLFMSIGQSAANLTYYIPGLIESHISFRRLEEVLLEPAAVQSGLQTQELPEGVESIKFQNVSFGYDHKKNQLNDISLEIGAGQYIALVGSSGSGKSTALQLLARFYYPKEGAILFDNKDLGVISESSLRRYATLVTQDTFLFNTTIRDNLLLDQPELPEEAMLAAARQANIHHVIESWPDGYDTEVKQEGGTLSGGERQRLSIARALLRSPKLLMLDEVTAALDPSAEADINALLEQLRGQHTIVSVTHRLSSIVNADKIYVFHEGGVAESGKHDQLLQQDGLYKSLWVKQQGFRLSSELHSASVEGYRLAQLSFFKGIEPVLLEELARQFTAESFRAGDVIVKEGEAGDKFYIIARGQCEVLKVNGDEGNARVAVLLDGDHFGEIALLKNIPRTATVQACGPAIILSMSRAAFQSLTDEYPQIRTLLEQTLEKRT